MSENPEVSPRVIYHSRVFMGPANIMQVIVQVQASQVWKICAPLQASFITKLLPAWRIHEPSSKVIPGGGGGTALKKGQVQKKISIYPGKL